MLKNIDNFDFTLQRYEQQYHNIYSSLHPIDRCDYGGVESILVIDLIIA